jgi:hypothetical protein
MRVPVEGEELVSRDGQVWIVLRCHQARDDPKFFAVDLVRAQDMKHTARAVNLTWDELEDFCRSEGIDYPPPRCA